MANYDEFHQYVTSLAAAGHDAHTEHVWEFAQMIQMAIPGIKQEVKEEIMRELEIQEKEKNSSNMNENVKVLIDKKGIAQQIRDAIIKAFR